MFTAGPLFQVILNQTEEVGIHQGGTSSGKTYSILQALFTFAVQFKKSPTDQTCIITIVGQDVPNLTVGAIRQSQEIIEESAILQSKIKPISNGKYYNDSKKIIRFKSGAIIEFKSYKSGQDAKSGKRDYLFINEANGIRYDIYTELALRTYKKIFIDYNPNSEFWVHENLIGKPGVKLVISDHRHNPFLPKQIHDKIEALKEIDKELWKVYARGMTGKITGLVLTNWFIVDDIPEYAKPIAKGLDFGFTNDPSSLIDIFMQNDELWVDELIYETGLTNPDLSNRFKSLGVSKSSEIVADSSEPKSIEELKRLGWYVTAAIKGPDSVSNGIDILKRYKINVTRRSVNLRKELSSYKYRVDRDGKTLNEPIDAFNHAIDPIRYVALKYLKVRNATKPKTTLPEAKRTKPEVSRRMYADLIKKN